MPVLSIPIRTRGRIVVEGDEPTGQLLVIFHGYGQSAEEALADARAIPGVDAWRIAAVQGLHRFYSRGHERVVASWMTTQDRELAIVDNIAYIDEVLTTLATPSETIVVAGFSQGASMAYRAAQLCARTSAGVLTVAGDVPPELGGAPPRPWPRIFIGAGDRDQWFTPQKLDADIDRLRQRGAQVDVCRFAGGHEWTAELRDAAGSWLAALMSRTRS